MKYNYKTDYKAEELQERGRPERESIISDDDMLNLIILHNTESDYESFLEKL